MTDHQNEADAVIREAIKPYREMISSTPQLLSLLYDLDLLPEQIKLPVNALRVVVVCEMFKRLTPEALADLFKEPKP